MRTKRLLGLITCILILSVIFSSCASEGAAVEESASVSSETVVKEVESEETVTISFWHAYNETEAAVLVDTLIPAFEAEHPNIRVEALTVPYDEFHRKLLTSIAGGTAPDLIRADIIWVPEFADMGALVPLDEVMADFDTYEEMVFPGPLSTNYLNGHYYGLPLDTNTRVLIYNKEIFAEAGIENPPATMDEFLEVCEAIKGLGEDKYCFADDGTNGWAMLPWIWSFGGSLTDAEITTAAGYLNGDASKAAYEFLKNLLDEGYLHPGILGGSFDRWGAFGNGEVAMILEGPWFPTYFSMDTEYGYAPMLTGDGGSISVVGGEDIVMFQQSENKEAAAEFIRFMLSEDAQMKLAEVGQMPVIKSSLDTDYVKNHPYFGYFLEQLETAKSRTSHPKWTEIEDIFDLAGGRFLAGEGTFEEIFEPAVAEIDALLPLDQ